MLVGVCLDVFNWDIVNITKICGKHLNGIRSSFGIVIKESLQGMLVNWTILVMVLWSQDNEFYDCNTCYESLLIYYYDDSSNKSAI